MSQVRRAQDKTFDIQIRSGAVILPGELIVPGDARGVVLFAHGSGSSRHSTRNRFVAQTIRDAGVGTLLFDLLTKDEEKADRYTGHLRFDISLLAKGMVDATTWSESESHFKKLRVGYFGSTTIGA